MGRGRGACQGAEEKENKDSVFSQRSRERTVLRTKKCSVASNTAERQLKDRNIVAFGIWLI